MTTYRGTFTSRPGRRQFNLELLNAILDQRLVLNRAKLWHRTCVMLSRLAPPLPKRQMMGVTGPVRFQQPFVDKCKPKRRVYVFTSTHGAPISTHKQSMSLVGKTSGPCRLREDKGDIE